MKEIIDISVAIGPKTIVYPGEPAPRIKPLRSIKDGDQVNVSRIDTISHHGTHIDAPYHFLDEGKTLDQIPLDYWIGKALVVDMTGVDECITEKELKKIPELTRYEKVLFKTKNSFLHMNKSKFEDGYIYINGSAAKYLVGIGVKTVGFDYITVERFGSKDCPCHYSLLKANVMIIEALNLKDVTPGEYFLVCLPTKMETPDGAHARAVLIKE